jgi:hypothetical protein
MRALNYSAAPDYNRVRTLLEQLKSCSGGRKISAVSTTGRASLKVTSTRASREHGSRAPAVSLAEVDDEPIEQPKRVATAQARRGKARRDVEDTPLILDPALDSTPRRGARLGEAVKKARGPAVAEEEEEDQMLRRRLSGEGSSTAAASTAARRDRTAVARVPPASHAPSLSRELMLLGIKGPYEGSAIPIPLALAAESGNQGKTKRKGKSDLKDVITVGRGDEASSGCAIALGGDEYISERYET